LKVLGLGTLALCVGVSTVIAGPLPSEIKVDCQLGGADPPPKGVNVVARASTENPAPGLFNICYVNGFQSQPGSNWPKSLVIKNGDGTPLYDPDWPDEFLLDISFDAQRKANLMLILPYIKRCAKQKCDGDHGCECHQDHPPSGCDAVGNQLGGPAPSEPHIAGSGA
jgi:Glycoside-hydrolase family GH114